jgi:hypothetical protein
MILVCQKQGKVCDTRQHSIAYWPETCYLVLLVFDIRDDVKREGVTLDSESEEEPLASTEGRKTKTHVESSDRYFRQPAAHRLLGRSFGVLSREQIMSGSRCAEV